VQEFRVINSDYSTEFGRAVGGIVNIITRANNDWHGASTSISGTIHSTLSTCCRQAGTRPATKPIRRGDWRPIQKDKTFLYANYEAQRRGESPFYNSAVLSNITSINNFKTSFNLPVEPNLGSVLRTNDTTTALSASIAVSEQTRTFSSLFRQ